MTYTTIHLHPAPTSLQAIDCARALANFFEAELNVSSFKLDIRAPKNWIVGAMMSTTARELKTVDDGTGLPQLLNPRASEGIRLRVISSLTAQIGAQSGFESSVSDARFWLRMPSAWEGTDQK
ncbi:MAG: hypothetical protein ABMA14_23655 [Hyphomonadaceae bacterium]